MEVTPEARQEPTQPATPPLPPQPTEPTEAPAAPPIRHDGLLSDYWPKFKRGAIASTILMQFAVMIIVGLSLIVGGVAIDELGFWVTVLATLLASGALNIILINFILTPHRDLVTALSNSAGETIDGPLPSPNIPRYESDGMKPVLQFVYDLSTANDKGTKTPNQAALEASGAPLASALAQTTTGIVVMDAEGTIQFANKAAPVTEASDGSKRLDLLFETDQTFPTWLAKCRETAVHAEETWLRVPDRQVGDPDRRIFNVNASYEKGSAAEVVLALFDSTHVYQPEDEELDFIAFAAHELRGPITVIRGYLDVLSMELSEQLAPDQKELIKRLIVSANRLSGYINNILNTSKFDRRHLQIHLSETSLADIYDTVSDDMALRASSQNRLLSVTIPPDLPTVAADRSSLSEVISNLIDNAIKYSNEGGAVAVTAAVEGDYVKVSVQDHGIGMPGNVVGNLFHKFYRSHRSRETVAGTGIGLYICKAIVESHGGTIEVSSTEGEGSVFSFTVPIYASVAEKLAANDNTNAGLITSNEGWIKNHAKFKS